MALEGRCVDGGDVGKVRRREEGGSRRRASSEEPVDEHYDEEGQGELDGSSLSTFSLTFLLSFWTSVTLA